MPGKGASLREIKSGRIGHGGFVGLGGAIRELSGKVHRWETLVGCFVVGLLTDSLEEADGGCSDRTIAEKMEGLLVRVTRRRILSTPLRLFLLSSSWDSPRSNHFCRRFDSSAFERPSRPFIHDDSGTPLITLEELKSAPRRSKGYNEVG